MGDTNSEQILNLFKVLGAIVSVAMYLAPLPTFIDIRKKKSTEEFQWAPHMISLFNTTFLLFYAILKASGHVLISINAVGVLIHSFYVITFISFSPKACQVSRILQLICMEVISGSIIGLTSQIHGVHERREIVGWLSAAFNICGLGVPCYDTIQAVMTKDVASISCCSSIISTVNAIIWLCIGVLEKDITIMTPNAIGIFVGGSQIICYILYKKKGADNVERNPI